MIKRRNMFSINSHKCFPYDAISERVYKNGNKAITFKESFKTRER